MGKIPYLVFFVGGMPALMYQVAWQRVLTLYFGVDIYSTSVTVSTFLLGLGLGSLWGGWLADRVQRPARYYAGVEILMGSFGFFSLPLFSFVGQWLGGSALGGVIVADFVLLLIPTTLMGMTLPLMCRVVITNHAAIGRQLSWLYGVNTLGAAVGALLSAYLVIGLFGLDGATRLAAWLNILLALVVFVVLGIRVPEKDANAARIPVAAPGEVDGPTRSKPLGYPLVLAFSFVSGFTALGYEIISYRVLGIVLHGTVYVFGTILFFYLTGIALGSLLTRKQIDRGHCIQRFALCQLGIAAYVLILFTLLGHFSGLPPLRYVLAASFFTSFHPSLDMITGHLDLRSLYSLLDIGVWAVLILGVPAILMGYGFPNLMREGSRTIGSLGRSIGGIYFANILGSTMGGLAIGFGAIHLLGTENALRLLILLGCGVPIVLFQRASSRDAGNAGGRQGVTDRTWASVAGGLAIIAVAAFPGSGDLIRALHFADHKGVDYVGAEDRSGVSVLRRQSEVIAFREEAAFLGQRRLYIDGANHGEVTDDTLPNDWATQLALAAHARPQRVLSIGLGDGNMAATAILSPDVQELVIVELNGTLDQVLRRTAQGGTVLDSPKVRYVIDDGRRWLQAYPDQKFDVIMMWPLHAAHAFSGNLYSREFLEILSRHLESGGIFFSKTADPYATAKTIAAVFPYVLRVDSLAYIASGIPLRFDRRRLPGTPEEAARRITADREMISAHTRDAPINSDLKPNSEYYITYRFAWAMRPQLRLDELYGTSDPNRFGELFVANSPASPDQ